MQEAVPRPRVKKENCSRKGEKKTAQLAFLLKFLRDGVSTCPSYYPIVSIPAVSFLDLAVNLELSVMGKGNSVAHMSAHMLLFVKEALCKNGDIMSMYDLISGMVYIEFRGLEENTISNKGI